MLLDPFGVFIPPYGCSVNWPITWGFRLQGKEKNDIFRKNHSVRLTVESFLCREYFLMSIIVRHKDLHTLWLLLQICIHTSSPELLVLKLPVLFVLGPSTTSQDMQPFTRSLNTSSYILNLALDDPSISTGWPSVLLTDLPTGRISFYHSPLEIPEWNCNGSCPFSVSVNILCQSICELSPSSLLWQLLVGYPPMNYRFEF